GKKLTRAVESLAPSKPEEGGRGVGSGRGPVGAQADRPAGLVTPRSAPALVWSDPLPVGVPVRVRAPQDRQHVRRAVAARESPAHVRGTGRVRGPRGPERPEGAGGAGGQRGLAPGQGPGRSAQRGAALFAAVHPGAATGRAPVATGSGELGEPVARPHRPAQGDRARPRELPGRSPRRGSAQGRIPLGRRTGTVTFQHDLVLEVMKLLLVALAEGGAPAQKVTASRPRGSRRALPRAAGRTPRPA